MNYKERSFYLSKKTDKFEQDIVDSLEGVTSIPTAIPHWMINLGIRPGANIVSVNCIGSSGSKTDVFIKLEDSEPIKISAKLSSAAYFGNWYSHDRVIREFGKPAFGRLVTATTDWANLWKINPAASLFVGVSISFGERSGNTFINFTDVFKYDDIIKVVGGVGEGEDIANCLYVSSEPPNDINYLFKHLNPIDQETINRLSSNFNVIFRPVNPMNEYSNRGKCIYTLFKPYERLSTLRIVECSSELLKLGEFVEVEANSLNHNRLLNKLESDYNIKIPRKSKT